VLTGVGLEFDSRWMNIWIIIKTSPPAKHNFQIEGSSSQASYGKPKSRTNRSQDRRRKRLNSGTGNGPATSRGRKRGEV
jgi:hypothetical protein